VCLTLLRSTAAVTSWAAAAAVAAAANTRIAEGKEKNILRCTSQSGLKSGGVREQAQPLLVYHMLPFSSHVARHMLRWLPDAAYLFTNHSNEPGWTNRIVHTLITFL
jgi:hypothetical protein